MGEFNVLSSAQSFDSLFIRRSELYSQYVISNAYVWGLNTSGPLGLGDTADRSSPVYLGTNSWRTGSVAHGSNDACAFVRQDGTLWAWGINSFAQLGIGNTVSKSSPVQVGSLTNWKQVTLSTYALAIKADGTLWAWGRNSEGQLGIGNTLARSSPVQVGLLANWKQVSASGVNLTAAVKTDGTLWAWGDNTSGSLGLGDTVGRSSPVQVGLLTNWKQVTVTGSSTTSGVVALKTDGTLWAWGDNTSGRLGLGDTAHRSSPVQVGSLADWTQGLAGNNHVLAVKTDGTLWSWGLNSSGQLGLSDVTNRSSPVRVGALTTWAEVGAGINHTLAVKTDGTLWAWGFNGSGQLGLGDTASRSSPVQVGSQGNWRKVIVGGNTSMVIR